MSTQTFTGKAIVSHDTLAKKGWKMEEVSTTADMGDNELVVEMLASGICHTDVLFGGLIEPPYPFATYPRIVGHEGSGYVRAIGRNVKSVQIGDAVLLSYNHCHACNACKASHHSYCEQFGPLNFGGRSSFTLNGNAVPGSFFGQSSFANFSIVSERSVVNVKDIVKDKKELALFSPLGCGIQTGAGTVINAAKPSPQEVVVVVGLGGVGLSAIMGAKICGCRTIIGIDRVSTRTALAKELGATHTIDTSQLGGKDVVDVVKELCGGVGPDVTVETTGHPPLITSAVTWTRNAGRIYQVGSAPIDFKLDIHVFMFMVQGKTYRGVVEGESNPPNFVPKLIDWYREGKLPIDKFVKFMKAEEFEKGLEEMHDGTTVKPVLMWS